MHKQIALPILLIGLLIGSFVSAQVKIGENPQTIDPASVLELESTDRVLVITRVDSLQMAAIAPIRGALVYNTSADCVFYYDGTDWINLCGGEAAVAGFTTDPIVNDVATIVITPTPTGGNIEIARNSINSSMVVDGGISGIKIQNGSIGRGKLQNNSVDRTKLAENSVGPFAIDNDSVDLADFNNITGFIRSADIVSGNAGNAIVAGGDGGAFYDDAAVAANTAAIAAAVAADNDKNSSNEIQTLSYDAVSRTITLSQSGGSVTLPVGAVEVDGDVSNELITASVLNGNILTITEGGNPFDIDLTGLGGGGGGTTIINSTPSITVSGDGSAATPYELATVGGGGGDDNQTAAEVPVTAIPTNYTAATQDVEAHLIGIDAALASGGGGSDNQTAVQVPFTPYLTIESTDVQAAVQELKDELDVLGIAGGTTEIVDGTTLSGLGTTAEPFTIAPGTDGQFLSTNVTGDVVWAVPPGGSGGGGQDLAAVLAEGSDANANPIKNLLNPVDPQDAATRSYVDGAIASGGLPLNDGSILIGDATNAAQPVPISGDATMDNAGVLTIAEDAITSTTILDGQVQTDDIADSNITDAKIAPGVADQILRTTADGSAVTWVDLPVSPVTVDGTTIIGDGDVIALSVPTDGITTNQIADGTVATADIADNAIETIKILDANVTNAKIAPGAADQILRTTADGSAVNWVDLPETTAGLTSVSVNASTFSGDGTAGNQLELIANSISSIEIEDNAVETDNILNNAVTIEKIASGTDGQVLTTSGTNVIWAAPTTGPVFTNTDKITGDGTTGNLLTIANDAIGPGELQVNAVTTNSILNANVIPAKLAPSLTDGEVLTTVGGNVVWASGAVTTLASSDGSITLVQTGSNYNLSVAEISGGAGGLIAPNSITQGDLATNSVDNAEIRTGAVRTGEILDGTITNVDIDVAAAIDGSKIIPNFVAQIVATAGMNSGGDIIMNGNNVVPDYVFQKYFLGNSKLKTDYNFKSLKEIESFIKKHHHLPGIKSAAEVKKDGSWNLSESNLQNLEKIEELYLHTIEQEKKINRLQLEKETLSDKVEALRNDLDEIKALLKKSE